MSNVCVYSAYNMVTCGVCGKWHEPKEESEQRVIDRKKRLRTFFRCLD